MSTNYWYLKCGSSIFKFTFELLEANISSNFIKRFLQKGPGEDKMIEREDLDEEVLKIIIRELKFPGSLHFKDLTTTQMIIYLQSTSMLDLRELYNSGRRQYKELQRIGKLARDNIENYLMKYLDNGDKDNNNQSVDEKNKEKKNNNEEIEKNKNICKMIELGMSVSNWICGENINNSYGNDDQYDLNLNNRHHDHYDNDYQNDHDRGEEDNFDDCYNSKKKFKFRDGDTDINLNLNLNLNPNSNTNTNTLNAINDDSKLKSSDHSIDKEEKEQDNTDHDNNDNEKNDYFNNDNNYLNENMKKVKNKKDNKKMKIK